MENKNDKKSFIVMIAILLVIALIGGGTYAYWVWRGNVAAVNVTTSIGNIGLTLNGGDGVIGKSATAGLAPAACTNANYASKDTVTINYYNQTDFPARVTLTLTLNSFTWNHGTKPDSTQLGNIKYALSTSPSACTNISGDANGTLSNIPGTFANATVGTSAGTAATPNYKLFDLTFLLPANTGTESAPATKTYYLYFWIDAAYAGVNGSATSNGSGVVGDSLQDINFQAIWTASNIEQYDASASNTGAAMLISKANAANVTTYSAGNTGEMYTFSQPATDQAEATTDYRYIGNSPNNYIEFNNETWRIIGVFDDRIKIIKDTPLTSLYWDYKMNGVGSATTDYGSNDWVDSQLMYMLNPDDIARNVALKTGYTYDGSIVKDASKHIIYQKGCKPAEVSTTTTSYSCTTSPWSLNAEALTQIDDATYYLGGASTNKNHNAVSYYTFERGSTRYNDTRSLNWTGKVGLMYPSDYAYTFAYGVDDTCYNDGYSCNSGTPSSSWLYYEDEYRWTIAPYSGNADGVFYVSSYGGVSRNVARSDSGVAPVVYLKSDIVLEGNGTNDTNIYKIVN